MNEETKKSPWIKVFCIIGVIGALQFIIITLIAMLTYPDGYNFFGHYFSDLGTTVTRNGVPNPISRALFVIASVVAGGALILFWIVIPTIFKDRLITKLLSWIGSAMGIISAPLLMLLAIFAGNVFPNEHMYTTLYFFLLFALAIIVYSIAIILNKNYPSIYSIISIGFSVVIILFIFGFFMVINVLMQKIVVYGFCLWTTLQTYKVWKTLN